MVTKAFLRKEVEKLHNGRRKVYTDKINESMKAEKEKAWEEAIKDEKVSAYLKTVETLFSSVEELPTEFMERARMNKRMGVTGRYEWNTTSNDAVETLKHSYTWETKAPKEVIELRKKVSAVDEEFHKLNQIIDVNLAPKAYKLFKELGLDFGEEEKRELAVINVDMTIIKGDEDDVEHD